MAIWPGPPSNSWKMSERALMASANGPPEPMAQMPSSGSILGNPVLRKEDPGILEGTTRYYDDLAVAGLIPVTVARADDPSGPGKSIGAQPFVGPNGELYVAWNDYHANAIVFNRSFDGGKTWGTAHNIASKSLAFDIALPAEFSRGALVYPACAGSPTSTRLRPNMSSGSRSAPIYRFRVSCRPLPYQPCRRRRKPTHPHRPLL